MNHPRGAERGALVFVLLLLWPALFVAPVQAQPAPPAPTSAQETIEARQVGWDGIMGIGAWNPLRVRVVGGRNDVDARLEVVLKVRQSGPQGASTEQALGAYAQDLSLAAGATKETVFWVPASSGMSITIRLEAGERVLAEEALPYGSVRLTVWPIVGVLADTPSLAQRIAQQSVASQAHYFPAQLAPADLPATPERLGALSALVVQGRAASGLATEQRRALRDWVAGGGHLVLSGGLQGGRALAVLPSGTLPVTYRGADDAADLAPLASWAEMPGFQLPPGPASRFEGAGPPLAGSPDRPLAQRFSLGQGTITLLAVDPALEPLASWSGTPAVLRKALEPALPPPGEDERQRAARLRERATAQRLVESVEALPPDVYPSWQIVVLILGGFAFVVGPLAHVVLARLGRRDLLWLLVPGAALGLSGALYLVGVGRDGRDVLGNVVSYVRLDPDAGRARQYLAAGFFAPLHATLGVAAPSGVPVRAAGRWDDFQGFGSRSASAPSAEPLARVLEGQRTRVEFSGQQWAMRMVTVERSPGGELGGLTARLERDGAGIVKGTVRNDTPFRLEDTAVMSEEGLALLGDLAPGESAVVEVSPPARVGPPPEHPAAWWYQRWQMMTRSFRSSGSSGGRVTGFSSVSYGGSPPDRPDAELQRRIKLLDATLSPQPTAPNQTIPPLALTFVAFTDQPVGDDFPNVGGRPLRHLTLLEQRLYVQ